MAHTSSAFWFSHIFHHQISSLKRDLELRQGFAFDDSWPHCWNQNFELSIFIALCTLESTLLDLIGLAKTTKQTPMQPPSEK